MMNPYEVSEDVFLPSGSDEEDEQPLQCSFSQILKGGDVFFSDFLSEPTLMTSELNNNNISSAVSGKSSTLMSSSSTAQAFSNLVNSMNLMDSFLVDPSTTSSSSHLYLDADDDEGGFSSTQVTSKPLQITF